MPGKSLRVARADAAARSKGERSRQHLKQAIAELASTRGVAEITLADICEAAGLTTGAVYFHFRNKDDALEAMVIDEVRLAYGDMLERAGGMTAFGDLLDVVITGSSRFQTARKGLSKAVQTVINSRPRAYEAWIAARVPVIARLQEAIAAIRAEHLLPTRPSGYLAHMILNSIEDLAMDAFQWGNPTLAPYARDVAGWNRRQFELWSWAVLAPMPVEGESAAPARAAASVAGGVRRRRKARR